VWLLAHGDDRVGLETWRKGREHIVPTPLYLPCEVGAVPRLVGCASCTARGAETNSAVRGAGGWIQGGLRLGRAFLVAVC